MQKLGEFIKKYSHTLVFLLLEIIATLLIVQNSIYQRSRIVRVGNRIAGTWHKGVSAVTGYFGLKAENEYLAAENADLRAQLASSYISYSDSVFQVNDTVYKQRYSYTDAQVIKNSYNQSKNYMMINKGASQGVRVDMAVISPQGIVGVVVNTTKNFSTIMPVLHSDSRHSVKLKRTNSTGSLIWEGGDYRYATLIDIPTTYPLYKNDTVVTSGLANDFPEGIAVGYIEDFTSVQGSGFYNIKIRLATDFNNLNHVYIVDNHFKAEQDSLMRITEAEDE
ncbi:MAG: rod shape-determining protein MreC [Bacteroidales bacterium]|nr:rod shape-determining protein MreC [Bacteroidales bacterium]